VPETAEGAGSGVGNVPHAPISHTAAVERGDGPHEGEGSATDPRLMGRKLQTWWRFRPINIAPGKGKAPLRGGRDAFRELQGENSSFTPRPFPKTG
jgi:hypothetical protein